MVLTFYSTSKMSDVFTEEGIVSPQRKTGMKRNEETREEGNSLNKV